MSLFEKVFSVFVLLLFVGFAILFFWFEGLRKDVAALKSGQIVVANTNQAQEPQIATDSAIQVIAQSDLESLQASVSALVDRVTELESGSTSSNSFTTTASPVFQKQIIHIGSASTKEREWTNSGVEVTLNTSDYPNGVTAQLEVGISIISGQGWARLVNKTTGAIIDISQVYSDSSEVTWKTSPSFKLHPGSNMYELQVRSTSGEVANFSSARIILKK